MKVLILGASGLLGRDLCQLLQKHGIEHLGTYHKTIVKNAVYLDCVQKEQVENLFYEYEPQICILSVVKRLTNICEKNWDETKQVNIDFVDQVSKLCRLLNIFLIHISTDYVFDGKNPPYFPDSHTNPLQNYGISKLMAEKRILSNMIRFVIIRVPVLYSQNIVNFKESAVTEIGKKVLNRIECTNEDDYYIRRPVFTKDICYYILNIINHVDDFQGIYHFYNPFDKYTKYQIAQMLGIYLQKSIQHIKPIQKASQNEAMRPYDTELQNHNSTIPFNQITRLHEGIPLCFQKIYHPKLFDNPQLDVSNIFLLLDLDGTLINSDSFHVKAYNKAFQFFHISLELTESILQTQTTDDFFKEHNISQDMIDRIKDKKKEYLMLEQEQIPFISGADTFIEWIHQHSINHCVVTNTSLSVVNYFKKRIPLLNKLGNWITRQDYNIAKPNPECYKKAVKMYAKNETYIIGFENTNNGLKSLQSVTSIIYMICQNKQAINNYYNEDVYLINNFADL